MKARDYGLAALLTSPVWVPMALIGYAGYHAIKAAARRPKTTIAALAIAGLLWCYGDAVRKQAKGVVDYTTQAAVRVVDAYDKERIASLEERIKRMEVPARPHDRQIADAPQHTTPVQEKQATQLAAITDPDFNFYYVKQDDTLSGIARKITGSKAAAARIAHDNGIYRPEELTTGQLLRIRKGLCAGKRPDVFSRVPRLTSIVLRGDESIEGHFGYESNVIARVYAVNRSLGLDYTRPFPYAEGKRVVWLY